MMLSEDALFRVTGSSPTCQRDEGNRCSSPVLYVGSARSEIARFSLASFLLEGIGYVLLDEAHSGWAPPGTS